MGNKATKHKHLERSELSGSPKYENGKRNTRYDASGGNVIATWSKENHSDRSTCTLKTGQGTPPHKTTTENEQVPTSRQHAPDNDPKQRLQEVKRIKCLKREDSVTKQLVGATKIHRKLQRSTSSISLHQRSDGFRERLTSYGGKEVQDIKEPMYMSSSYSSGYGSGRSASTIDVCSNTSQREVKEPIYMSSSYSCGYGSGRSASTTDMYADTLQKEPFRKILHSYQQRRIKQNFKLIKKQVDPLIIMPRLYQAGYLEQTDYELIKSMRRRDGMDVLLRILLRQWPAAYDEFLNALDENDVYGYVRKHIEGKQKEAELPDYLMVPECRRRLGNHRQYLIDEIEPDVILDYFIEQNVFDADEHEMIFNKPSRPEKARALIDGIGKYLPRSFSVFEMALRAEGKGFVVEEMKLSVSRRNMKEGSAYCTRVVEDGEQWTNFNSVSSNSTHYSDVHMKLNLWREDKKGTMEAFQREILIQDRKERFQRKDITYKRLKNMSYEKSTEGSVILHFKPVSGSDIHQLLEICEGNEFLDFLSDFLSVGSIRDKLPPGRYPLDVTIAVTFVSQDQEKTARTKALTLTRTSENDCCSSIRKNMAFLVEELDAFSFFEVLRTKSVLTAEDVSEILQSANAKEDRIVRTRAMINKILEKGPESAKLFLDAINENASTYVINRLKNTSRPRVPPEIQRKMIVDNYTWLVEEISPSTLFPTFMDRNINIRDHLSNIETRHMCNRRNQAAMFIHTILEHENDVVDAFNTAIDYKIGWQKRTGVFTDGSSRETTHSDSPAARRITSKMPPVESTVFKRAYKVIIQDRTNGNNTEVPFMWPDRGVDLDIPSAPETRSSWQDVQKFKSASLKAFHPRSLSSDDAESRRKQRLKSGSELDIVCGPIHRGSKSLPVQIDRLSSVYEEIENLDPKTPDCQSANEMRDQDNAEAILNDDIKQDGISVKDRNSCVDHEEYDCSEFLKNCMWRGWCSTFSDIGTTRERNTPSKKKFCNILSEQRIVRESCI